MASFIHMDAAVDARTAEVETMAMNVAHTHDVPQSVSSFTSQLSSSNPDFTLSSLKSLAALGSPPLCPHRTFLALLILTSNSHKTDAIPTKLRPSSAVVSAP
jgi:hypothetical protein